VLSFRASLAFLLFLTLAISPAFATHSHRAPASGHSHSSTSKAKRARTASHAASSAHRRGRVRRVSARSHRLHGQQSIDPDRVTQIQEALIREHYLNGDATGKWDTTTQAAMQKYQADQGWQTRLMPDSRALKKLGLGADYSDAINAKGSTFADPPPVSTIPSAQTAGFTAAAGINQ